MLAERPRKPPEIVQGTASGTVFFFIPDEPSFGRWSSRMEATQMLDTWMADYRGKANEWQSYCRARGVTTIRPF